MERKVGSSTVTAKEVEKGLNRARTLTQEEEKVVRMRHGAGADRAAPLPKAAGGNAELADELLVIEMQLLKAMRARTGQSQSASKPKPAAAAVERVGTRAVNATKDKIVQALKAKKK